ncbi:phosphonate ABC transporter ATP-binding protein [Piscinibacter terrae]|uniref:ATP-binding cassette domain-containing protein n=1 Tax=Piscinibacter terrae TaxID=2496871 RepID=A0A3N7JSI0_9BURK|nr:ATP-binding cassette domain-containing protein [Albitalea terrae]RQP21965.1 ATP-binding cassette domain-containing protein [Albitalea terrae]
MTVDGPAVELRGLSAGAAPGASRAVLRGIDLRIQPREQVAVIGPSGAGKTSLLMAMACAVQPLGGSLRVLDRDPWAMSSAQRQALRAQLFLAPQVPPLPPRQRVVAAVLAGRLPSMGLMQSVLQLWHPTQAQLAQEALSRVDLADKLWDRVDRLSGGERQRVGLARLLVSQAGLWLVDEPLSALDPARAGRVMDAMLDAAAREGRTLVCSLHQVAVARERFKRIVALRGGEVFYDGPSAGLDDAAVSQLYEGSADDDVDRAANQPPSAAALPEAMCR